MMKHILLFALLVFSQGCGTETDAQTSQEAKTQPVSKQPVSKKRSPVLCRLFFQDHDAKELRWANVRAGAVPTLDETQPVNGFPKLDPEKQNLVQMRTVNGTLLVGVRDNDQGKHQSGWVMLSTGVREESHGNHAHWFYKTPSVAASLLDDKQGNPAHLYLYQGRYYLANDLNNGYTRIDPDSQLPENPVPVVSGFHQGGGNHITLAVTEDTTGYGTWIDGGGPNKGRVDVTRIKSEGNQEIAYSFHLPTGGIHGATTAADKIFFAPAEGICWVKADLKPESHSGEVTVHHIALGKDPETEKPLRTGAFSTHRNHVLFVSGQEDYATLNVLNATPQEPVLTKLKLPMKAGHSPTVPQVVKTAWGKRLAFLFHDHKGEGDSSESLTIINLDPNQDLNFEDAKVVKTISVGKSAVEGHFGHHEIAFDEAGKQGFFTNPGDGTISAISLDDFETVATFQVGGKPTKVLAVGQQNHAH